MSSTFARYLTVLIARDLETRNKELPSYIYEMIESYFNGGQFEKIEDFLISWCEKEVKNESNRFIK